MTSIENRTSRAILLKQTDPVKNPVVDSVSDFNGDASAGWWANGLFALAPPFPVGGKPDVHKWFTVGPKTILKRSWFVAPWANQDDAWVYLWTNPNNFDGTNLAAKNINLEPCGIQFNVSPLGGGSNDCLTFCERDPNPITSTANATPTTVASTPAAGNGAPLAFPVEQSGGASTTDLILHIGDQMVEFRIPKSNSASSDAIARFSQLLGVASSVVGAGVSQAKSAPAAAAVP